MAGDGDHVAQPTHRFGDLLPLPLLPESEKGIFHNFASRRRCRRQRRLETDANASVRSLNIMAGFEDESLWPRFPQNAAQGSSLGLIRRAHAERVWPEGVAARPGAALSSLLRTSPAYGSGAGTLAPFEDGKVSLPRDRGGVLLSDVLPDSEVKRLREFKSACLLPDDEFGHFRGRVVNAECYFDSALEADEYLYARLIVDLWRAGVISFTENVKVQVGLFVVAKKT